MFECCIKIKVNSYKGNKNIINLIKGGDGKTNI